MFYRITTLFFLAIATSPYSFGFDAAILYATWGQDGCRIAVVDNDITEWEGCTIPDPPTQEEYDAAEALYLAAQQDAADTAAAGVLTAKQRYAEHLIANGVPVDADMDQLETYMDAMLDAATDLAGIRNATRAIMRAVIRRYAAAERELKARGHVK
jgi:hypothetical protein